MGYREEPDGWSDRDERLPDYALDLPGGEPDVLHGMPRLQLGRGGEDARRRKPCDYPHPHEPIRTIRDEAQRSTVLRVGDTATAKALTMRREIDSFIDRKHRTMRTNLLAVAATLLAAAFPAFADSARNTYPQLVGVDTVALHLSSDNLPGLDADAIERDIRSALENAGIRVQPTAPVTLFVRITFQQLPPCPELIAFRTYLALSEDVEIHRGNRTETVYVDTWHEGEDLIEPPSRAGKAAQQSVLGLLAYFLDAARYSAKVMEKQASPAPPEFVAPAEQLNRSCPSTFEMRFSRSSSP